MVEERKCDICERPIVHHEDGAIIVFGWWKDRGDEWELDMTDNEFDVCQTCAVKLGEAVGQLRTEAKERAK